jgi:hypothetical protein
MRIQADTVYKGQPIHSFMGQVLGLTRLSALCFDMMVTLAKSILTANRQSTQCEAEIFYNVELPIQALSKVLWIGVPGMKKGTAHQRQNLILSVKYGGGSIMVWGCFAASGPGQFAIIDGKMNSQEFKTFWSRMLGSLSAN